MISYTNKRGCLKKKIVCFMATAAAISSFFASIFIIRHVVKYGALFDNYNLPENVYEQNPNVPDGYFNENPIVVAVSNDFSVAEFNEIEKSINTLDDNTEGIKFEIVRTSKKTRKDDCQILILKDTNKEYTNNSVQGAAFSGFTNIYCPECYCGTIFLYNDISKNIIQSITIHEILHILGFKHERDHTSIMAPKCGFFNKQPTKKDVENINKVFPTKKQNQEELTIN